MSFLKTQWKKQLPIGIFTGIVFYFVDKCFWLYRQCVGNSLFDKLGVMFLHLELLFYHWYPSLYLTDLLGGFAGAAIFLVYFRYRKLNAKKFRKGEEYGSARWGNEKDIAPFIDPVFENNILFTMTERLTMNGRPKLPKYARNKNVLVIGGSGSGKTRFYLKPNLMQMPEKVSYVVTDPKGTLLPECGKMLVNHGYQIRVLNTINFSKSMHYNPFQYIHSEKDILKLVNTIIANTKGEGEKATEDFWVKAERLLYSALIGFIWYEAPEEEQNFSTLLEFINASETKEDDENFQNAVDLLFEELEQENPEHFAVRQYQKYKLAAGKTAKSILISCGARLAPFDIKELRELLSYDELQLDLLGDQKSAFFVIISDTDDKEMGRDGICRVKDGTYSKTIRFNDINYQLAQNEDKNAIFEGWCDFLNYFDTVNGKYEGRFTLIQGLNRVIGLEKEGSFMDHPMINQVVDQAKRYVKSFEKSEMIQATVKRNTTKIEL